MDHEGRLLRRVPDVRQDVLPDGAMIAYTCVIASTCKLDGTLVFAFGYAIFALGAGVLSAWLERNR